MTRHKQIQQKKLLEELRARINELKLRIYGFGLTQEHFLETMRQILSKLHGKIKKNNLKTDQHIKKVLFQILKKAKHRSALIIEILTQVDREIGFYESSESEGKSESLGSQINSKVKQESIKSGEKQLVKLQPSIVKKEHFSQKSSTPKEEFQNFFDDF